MEKEFILQRGELSIPVKINEPDFEIKRVVLGVHGIGGSTDDAIQSAMAEEMGLFHSVTFRFDFPAHGKSPMQSDEFSLKACKQALAAVAAEARRRYPEVEDLCIFASGFGAYVTLLTLDEILELPDVKERVDLYFEQQELFKQQVARLAKVYGRVVVLDLRDEETIYAGNRFMIYALYPEAQISIHVAWGFKKQNTAVMIGKSIINKGSNANIGDLCLKYGGGGHRNAGTCQIDNDKVDDALPDIIAELNKDCTPL